MAAYRGQADKDANLRILLGYLVKNSQPNGPGKDDTSRDLARQKAYDDAARRLREILDTPVAEPEPDPVQPDPNVLHMAFQPEDMCVVVVAPLGALGVERTLTFDRSTRDFMREDDYVDRWTKLVAAALLRDALGQLGG